jgi:PAS domain S-box-containing protein
MALKLREYDQMNIKELMKEKQKIEAIVENIGDGILVTGAANRVLLMNNAALKIFNIKKEQYYKKHFLEVIKNEDLFRFIEATKSKETYMSGEFLDIAIRDKRDTNYYRAIARPIINAEGSNVGVVTILQYITKLKQIDELKSEFISSASHELRTPLTSIIIAADLLDQEDIGKTNKQQKELINVIVEDGERLNNLINDLLDLSRLESGRTRFDIRPKKITDIINNVLKIMDIQLKEKGVEIDIKVEKGLPEVMADSSKLSQVLTNHINNSINYKIEDKPLKITISAKRSADKILISVADNGKGISEEERRNIFNRFIRAGSSERAGIKGTGLGLSICKEIVEGHGGTIWVESTQEKGSAFFFTLNASE